MTDLDLMGRMLAYMASGADFQKFADEQEIEQADRAELQTKWERIAKWREENPGVAMDVPSD